MPFLWILDTCSLKAAQRLGTARYSRGRIFVSILKLHWIVYSESLRAARQHADCLGSIGMTAQLAEAGRRPIKHCWLRLTMSNCVGFRKQPRPAKGVDSLIVTDMIELARQKAICDILLLSGDEDVRIGVQIAQNHGVRVHLLGIHPARGSQSQQLPQEADTTREWMVDDLRKFLTIKEREIGLEAAQGASADPKLAEGIVPQPDTRIIQLIEEAVKLFVQELELTAIQGVDAYWTTARGVPPDLDRRLLPTCRDKIGRDLEKTEIRAMRAEFQIQVKIRLAEPSGPESRKS